MDRRSLLFVLSLTLALFFVNTYFQKDHDERTRQWTEQQKTKKVKQIQTFEKEIAQNTASLQALPTVELFSEPNDNAQVATGVSSGPYVLTTQDAHTAYSKLYRKAGSSFEELKRLNEEGTLSALQLYGPANATGQEKLIYKAPPDFGRYPLQVLTSDSDPKVYLGEYLDGNFTLLPEKVEALQHDLGERENPSSTYPNALALLKTTQGYEPVGVYVAKEKNLYLLNEIESITPFVKTVTQTQALSSNQKTQEKFYVLENDYIQLVFSNYGAALSEINLPFKDKQDENSVVREIEFDRDMVKNHPYNAMFPSHSYFTAGSSLDNLVEHDKGKLGGYYPLIRRDLIEKAPRKSVKIEPKYYALNIVSEYPEMAELVYEVKEFSPTHITFEARQSQRRITKTFSLSDANDKSAPYILDLSINIEGDGRGLWLTSGVPEVEWISGGPAPSLKYRITRNQKATVETIDLPKESTTASSIYLDWISNSNGFLGLILDPLSKIDGGYRVQQVSGVAVPSRLVEIQEEYDRFKAANLPGYNVMLPLTNSGGTMEFRVFAGPFADSVLETIDHLYSDPATGYNPDYIASQTFHGWFAFISEPFADFLFILMRFFHYITGSWALSIILLTVALRIMMYPLNAWSTKSMLAMQQIAPEITAIQEKNKKDPKKAQLEIMNLYREKGVNPLSGCLPLLLQMPFLIGMFDLLKSTFELRGASFIPGWINDLTAPDVLFSWSRPIFFIGNEFHLLPFLLGGVMFLQQRLMSNLPSDPNLLTDQQRQQRAMGSVMPILFTVMFYNFPSGLNIYWLSSMLLGILQQWWTQKQMQKQPVSVAELPVKKSPAKK